MSVPWRPAGSPCVIPYLIVDDPAKLIDFLAQVFEATEVHRFQSPEGAILHAAVQIGESRIMMGQACKETGPITGSVLIYVPDVDETYWRALEFGAEPVMEPADQFYGDRSAGVKDPTGATWWIETQKELLSDEELHRRHEERTAATDSGSTAG